MKRIVFDFFNFVLEQNPKTIVQNKNLDGTLSWKYCAIGRFIQEALGFEFIHEDGSDFQNAKISIKNELAYSDNISDRMLWYRLDGSAELFNTYGDIQAVIKSQQITIPKLVLDFYDFVFDHHTDTKIDNSSWGTCAVGLFCKKNKIEEMYEFLNLLPIRIFDILDDIDDAPKRYGGLQKLITEETGFTR